MSQLDGGTCLVLVLASGVLGACGFSHETCEPCSRPADSIVGFPNVQKEAGTSRVVSNLRVGESVYVCIFADCGCRPGYDVQWVSTDPSVASLEASSAVLSVCNDAFEVAPTGSAQRVAELKGLRPGETQVSAIVAGPTVPREVVRAMHCSTGVGGGECFPVDVVRVVP